MLFNKLIYGSFICLIIFVLALVWTFYGFPTIINTQIDKNTRLENGTKQWDRFVHIPFPFTFNVYIFNVSNPKEILQGAKPIVQEIGPYVYNQYRNKNISSENSTEDVVTFTQKAKFEFNEIKSHPLKDDDVLTILNPALLTIFHKTVSYEEKRIIYHYLDKILEENNSLFIKVKIKDFLFNGIDYATETNSFRDTIYNMVAVKVRYLSESVRTAEVYKKENGMRSVKFAALKYKNNTADGNYTIFRGIKDIFKLGEIQKWNGSNKISTWGSNKDCSNIHGGDGTIFAPHRAGNDEIITFSTDICRTIQLPFNGITEYKGIKGYLYQSNNRTFWSRTKNPEDDCYCTKSIPGLDNQPTCFLDGVIDVTKCFGCPIVISHPHFLWANEKYSEAVGNLHPNEEKHKMYLVLEPDTGIPLAGMKRAQINFVVRPDIAYPNVQPVLFPVFWVEEGILLDQKYIDELNGDYFNLKNIATGVSYAMISASFIGYLIFSFFVFKKMVVNKKIQFNKE